MLKIWAKIAARDGAITIYNFSESIKGIRSGALANKSIKNLVDWPTYEQARDKFRESFPTARNLRHAVSHAAEMMSSSKQRGRNIVRKDFQGHGFRTEDSTFHVSQGIHGTTFFSSHANSVGSYEVTEETLKTLQSVRDGILKSFQQPSGDADEIKSSVDQDGP
jgi:hypothetical protein